jgi:hypothetical protein
MEYYSQHSFVFITIIIVLALHVSASRVHYQVNLFVLNGFVTQLQHTVSARVLAALFLTRIYPPKSGCGVYTEYYVLLTTEPATPVLYVIKLPVETASV